MSTAIHRHVARVGERRVHFLTAGEGPPLLLVHQSPRSAFENLALIESWAGDFTCIAPDTPGFGHSDALPKPAPDVRDFAQALLEFMDAVGLGRVAGYGFHSGGVFLAEAARLQPHRFTGLAIGGYPIFTEAEMAAFAEAYLPELRPQAFGEHLVWLWNRALEQSWFFPWYRTEPTARLGSPHADPARVQAVVEDLLNAGDAYRAGYGAALRAPANIPGPDEPTPEVLILAHDGDPLQAHLARLPALPTGWRAEPVPTRAELDAASHAFLRERPAAPAALTGAAPDEGFVRVDAAGFRGLVHWAGDPDAETLVLHAPGAALNRARPGLHLDLPGHGLSDGWPEGCEPDFESWAEVAAAAARAVSPATRAVVLGTGLSALLALKVGALLRAQVDAQDAHIPAPGAGARWIENTPPRAAPDRHGHHLTAAWSRARARVFFWPWFDVSAASAIPFDPADVTPERLAGRHLELMRARGEARLTAVLLQQDREALLAGAAVRRWNLAPWAEMRADIWRPKLGPGR